MFKKSHLTVVLILITMVFAGYKLYGVYFYNGELIGIKGSYTYHRDSCKFVKKASTTQLIFFKNIDETASLEYRPCKTCDPPDNSKIASVYKEKKVIEEKAGLEKSLGDFQAGKYITPMERRKLLEKGYITQEQYDNYKAPRYSVP